MTLPTQGGEMKAITMILLLLVVAGCSKKVKEEPVAPFIESYHRLAAEDRMALATDQKSSSAGDMAVVEAARLKRAMEWEDVIKLAIADAESECKDFIDDRTAKSESKKKWPAVLMITGIVASSVVVPTLAAGNAAAHAGWIAGVGGLSGGAIATSKVLESSGLSGATDARERNSIAKVYRELAGIALDPTRNIDERMRAAIKMKAECMAPDIHVPTVNAG